VFPATSNKREIADKQKMDDSNNSTFLEGPTRFTLPSLQKTERASEDPNLSIDNRRKIMLP